MNTMERQSSLTTKALEAIMDNSTAAKLAEIMNAAALTFAKGESIAYGESVGKAFWKAFDKHEQSCLMQEVYITLCNMGMTPLESEQ